MPSLIDRFNYGSTFTLLQIIGNYLIPLMKNKSIGEISDQYTQDFSPDTWVFSIWGIIYSFLFSGYYGLSDLNTDNVKKFLNSDNIKDTYKYITTPANIAWVYSWTSNNIGVSTILLYILAGSLVTIIRNKNLWNTIKDFKGSNDFFGSLILYGFSFYTIWTLYAANINTSLYLKKNKLLNNMNVNNMLIYSFIFIQIIWQGGVGPLKIFDSQWESISKKLSGNLKNNLALVSLKTLPVPIVGMVTALAFYKNKKYKKRLLILFIVSLIGFIKQINDVNLSKTPLF